MRLVVTVGFDIENLSRASSAHESAQLLLRVPEGGQEQRRASKRELATCDRVKVVSGKPASAGMEGTKEIASQKVR